MLASDLVEEESDEANFQLYEEAFLYKCFNKDKSITKDLMTISYFCKPPHCIDCFYFTVARQVDRKTGTINTVSDV